MSASQNTDKVEAPFECPECGSGDVTENYDGAGLSECNACGWQYLPASPMTYTIKLDSEMLNALLWIADRYTSAEVLWDGSEWDEETETLTVPEHVAWDYVAALPEDNGVADAILPPCAGGPLADALIDFYTSIV